MSIATQISRLQQAKAALKEAVNKFFGADKITSEKLDSYADAIEQMPLPATLEIGATTVRISASQTVNVASNDHVRVLGSDGEKYTLAEWNALFVAAGYNKANMNVSPVGISVDAYEHSGESYLFDRFVGGVWDVVGDASHGVGKLQHSINNQSVVTGAANGTDYTTGKAWRVTADGDNLVLYEANTGQSWTMAKNCGFVYAHKAYNIEDRTHSLWAQTEWMRHRMAISSGIATSRADGTMGEISILNASGAQAAVGEDMYFWVKNDSGVFVDTGILAKYNLNNRHTVNSANLTAAIRDAIYARQKANGINMNDTGVNSASKPILAPGSKGAEVIAVGGYWYIITPFISNPSATTATATNNMADAPAVYWAKHKGYSLPSDTLLLAMYLNKTLCDAIVSYLNTREGWGLSAIPDNDNIWSAVRSSAPYCWIVYFNYGVVYYVTTSVRYYVVGASAS